MPMLDRESAINRAKQMLGRNQTIEDILSDFRKEGFSKLESVNVIKESVGISFEEARNLVHFSETWQDTFERDTELLETFYDLLESGELFSEQKDE